METFCKNCKHFVKFVNYKQCKKCKNWYCNMCSWIEDDNNPEDLCDNCYCNTWCHLCKSTYEDASLTVCIKCKFCNKCNQYLNDGQCKRCKIIICPRCHLCLIDNVCFLCKCTKCDSEMILSKDKKYLYCITCSKN